MSDEKLRPCGNCPWRKDAPREYWDPQHFRDIYRNCQGNSMHTMLCHKSPSLPKERLCAGWAAIVGFESIGLRIQALMGKYHPDNLDTSGLELFETFDEMLEANNIDL